MSIEMNMREGAGEVDNVTIDRHLYHTEDQSRVVEEGDPDGRWLWARPGLEVPREEAERLGAVKPEVKERAKPADKARKAPPNKGA